MAVKKQFSSFGELLSSAETPVLVDFYATWCGPCQIMAQVLEQVKDQLAGQVQIVKIDTDKYPNLASQYLIQGLPTLILFKNGEPIDRIEGAMQAPQLVQHLHSVL